MPKPSILLIAQICVISLFSGACMLSPTDGTAVPNTSREISFVGYLGVSNREVSLQARNPASGHWSEFGSAQSGSSVATQLFGYNAYAWSTSARVPSAYWAPGSTGSIARVRASDGNLLQTMKPHPLSCYGEYLNDLTGFLQNCSAGQEVRLCTSNYLPFGRRRSDCSPSSLGLSISDGTTRSPDMPKQSTLMVPVSDDILGTNGGPEIEHVTLRGDRSLQVELFNLPLFDASFTTPGRVGWYTDALFFNAIRVQYPYARNDLRTYSVSVDSARQQLGLSDVASNETFYDYFGTAISARVYDVGECSYGVSWDEIAEQARQTIRPLVEQDLRNLAPGLIESITLTEFYIRPVQTSDRTDRIYVRAEAEMKVDISCCNRAKISFGATLIPTTSDTLPLDLIVDSYHAGVYDIRGVILRIVDRWFIDLNDAINQYAAEFIPESIGQYLLDALPIDIPSYVRARRVLMTAGGLEAVLAEDTDDVQYDGIVNANLGGFLCPKQPSSALQRSNWYFNRGL